MNICAVYVSVSYQKLKWDSFHSGFSDKRLTTSFLNTNIFACHQENSTVPVAAMDSDEFSDPEAEVNETRAKPGGGSESRASSAFVAAFGNLKKSEFYKAPEPLPSSSAHPGATRAPAPGGSEPGAPKAATGRTNCVLVSHKQRGNPLLKSICNVPWEYSEIVPDYVMGKTTCALFLSLRYHNLNPDYINERLKLLGRQYELRVLLVQVDVKEPNHALKNLTRICILADLTMMLAWSAEEAGRIVETYKIYENKPPDLIMERPNSSPHQQLVSALTSVRSVNKTDAATLLSTFGSLERVIRASPDALGLCPGLGAQKAGRLHRVLHQPFVRHRAAAAASRRGARE